MERAYFEKTGIFPIMHTVVLKEELVRAHPWLPRALYEAFVEAKRLAYQRLADTAVLPYVLPWLVAEVEETRALMGDDPFPYGVRRTRKTVETLAGYSFRQGLAPRRSGGGGPVLRVAARHVGSRRAGPHSPAGAPESRGSSWSGGQNRPSPLSRSAHDRALAVRANSGERERRSDGRAPATQGLSPTEPSGARETSYWQASVEPTLAAVRGNRRRGRLLPLKELELQAPLLLLLEAFPLPLRLPAALALPRGGVLALTLDRPGQSARLRDRRSREDHQEKGHHDRSHDSIVAPTGRSSSQPR